MKPLFLKALFRFAWCKTVASAWRVTVASSRSVK